MTGEGQVSKLVILKIPNRNICNQDVEQQRMQVKDIGVPATLKGEENNLSLGPILVKVVEGRREGIDRVDSQPLILDHFPSQPSDVFLVCDLSNSPGGLAIYNAPKPQEVGSSVPVTGRSASISKLQKIKLKFCAPVSTIPVAIGEKS